MGGGEGSTAREVLKHSSVKKVVMCDIDQVYDITCLCVPSCSFLLLTLLLLFQLFNTQILEYTTQGESSQKSLI
jgi:hypothetical protein